ncbi:putative monoglyceride lipase [Vaccinia virus]|uniref:Putative monoglyceride lipase n=1 Tax=Vaccinia virus TaxID=10245 RepID=A0A0M4RI44_VACCV|nr:putative monoglyceride lipase [Vaccinia virus]ALF05282.1 putative monoglyceride lipase [Vaccinia virus]
MITYPKALVFISHGAGKHSGRYDELAENISSLGILVFSHDHIGHGRSNGEKMMTLVQHVVTIKSTYWVIPWEQQFLY